MCGPCITVFFIGLLVYLFVHLRLNLLCSAQPCSAPLSGLSSSEEIGIGEDSLRN